MKTKKKRRLIRVLGAAGAATLGVMFGVPAAMADSSNAQSQPWIYDTFHSAYESPQLGEPFDVYALVSMNNAARPAYPENVRMCFTFPAGVQFLDGDQWRESEAPVCERLDSESVGTGAGAENYFVQFTVRAAELNPQGEENWGILVTPEPGEGNGAAVAANPPPGEASGSALGWIALNDPMRQPVIEGLPATTTVPEAAGQATTYEVVDGETPKLANGEAAHKVTVNVRNEWGMPVSLQGASLAVGDPEVEGVNIAPVAGTETEFEMTSTVPGRITPSLYLVLGDNRSPIIQDANGVGFGEFVEETDPVEPELKAVVTVKGEKVLANGKDFHEVNVTVTDEDGAPQVGKAVNFDFESPLLQISEARSGEVVTDSKGMASIKLASTRAGSFLVTVSVEGAQVEGAEQTLVFEAVDSPVTPNPEEGGNGSGGDGQSKQGSKPADSKGSLASTGAGLTAGLAALPLLGAGLLLMRRALKAPVQN